MTSKSGDTLKINKYLEKQNRPYSLNDLFLNLHKEIGKTAVQKCLDQLVVDGHVKEKVYGKQKVYVTEQSHFPSVNEVQLKELEREVSVLAESVSSKQQAVKHSEAAFKTIQSSSTTQEILGEIEKIETENELLQRRLETIEQQQQQSPICIVDRQTLAKSRASAVAEWRRRRRITRNVLDAILEGYPDSKQKLYEDIGIETDEDVGVIMPST